MRKLIASLILLVGVSLAVVGALHTYATPNCPVEERYSTWVEQVKEQGLSINRTVTGKSLENFNASIKLHYPDDDIPEMDLFAVAVNGDMAIGMGVNKGCTVAMMLASTQELMQALDATKVK